MNVRLSILFDYYGELLTEKQQKFFEDYYFSNLTLQEIADNNEISKTFVHKTLNIIEEKLEYYESVLKLYEKSLKIKDIIKNMNEKQKQEIIELI